MSRWKPYMPKKGLNYIWVDSYPIIYWFHKRFPMIFLINIFSKLIKYKKEWRSEANNIWDRGGEVRNKAVQNQVFVDMR